MPKKSLGQHWLTDRRVLAAIANEASLTSTDTVLEIGPGLGTLTSELLRRVKKVVAVEFDADLARKLPGQFPGKNLEVIHADILDFDLSKLPSGYKVVANVPYYITSKIVQKLSEAANPPEVAVILVQKEVAERIAAAPGDMSMLSVSAQVFFEATTGVKVPREYFTPLPEVDSQTVVLRRRSAPLVPNGEQKAFFRLVRAGFSERRKKLRSSLAGGLHMPKAHVDELLQKAGIGPGVRAQELSIEQWYSLQRILEV
ncbi:MAG TPA: 16S rRNA (adenine(1518)-N(6)/adenine(1519)-N(6))-dimethyltransferase RsmA [Candidatus Saccharimonadaceae bacterium]|nr:16S rRNA (adenine(1518)-N(6)/adenine(1519)-N(6))-dimethyltransferase RsmA [Candidatus Saccharimonadaceae bacterium]